MLPQSDLDSVLLDAQQAVESLAGDVARLDGNQEAPPGPSGGRRNSATAVASGDGGPEMPQHLTRILKLRVPVTVRLAGRPMMVNEVLKFVPGTIIEFDRRVDQELDLMAGNRQIGGGIAVKCNEHYGLKITYVGDVRERIASLAG